MIFLINLFYLLIIVFDDSACSINFKFFILHALCYIYQNHEPFPFFDNESIFIKFVKIIILNRYTLFLILCLIGHILNKLADLKLLIMHLFNELLNNLVLLVGKLNNLVNILDLIRIWQGILLKTLFNRLILYYFIHLFIIQKLRTINLLIE